MVAAVHLLLGLLIEAVDEFEVVAHHPLRGALGVKAAEKFEGCPDGNHHAMAEMGFEHGHEEFLLGGSEGDPDDVCDVILDHQVY